MKLSLKKSLFLNVFLLVLSLFLVDVFDLYQEIRNMEFEEKERLARSAVQELDDAQSNIQSPIPESLKNAQEAGKIGFFLVKSDQLPTSVSLQGLDVSEFTIIPDEHFRIWKDKTTGQEKAVYFTRAINNTLITIGMATDPEFFRKAAEHNARAFWRSALVKLFCTLVISIYFFYQISRKVEDGQTAPT